MLTKWKIGAYQRSTGIPIGPLTGAIGRQWDTNHNGIDSLTMGLRLDHQLAKQIVPLETVVKLWREVGEPGDLGYYKSPANRPDFCGTVGPLSEAGSGMTFNFTAFSPQYQLQYRFVRELLAFLGVDQSQIMWNLIDYTNGFDDTFIELGSIPTSITRDRHYDEDSKIWDMLVNMTNVIGGPDMYPEYVHEDGSPTLMRFNTVPARGVIRNVAFLDFRTGKNNCSDMGRDFDTENIGTYVKARGASDGAVPYAVASLETTDPDAFARRGLWERIVSFPSVKLEPTLQGHADAELERSKEPLEVVTPSLAVVQRPTFKADLDLGDVVPVRAKRGRMDFAVPRRVFGASVKMSELNMESVTLTVSKDFGQTVEDDDGTGGSFS